MDLKFFIHILFFSIVNASVNNSDTFNILSFVNNSYPDNVFNGVYTECFLHLSYSCLQKKTLLYLKELNNLSEVSVIGDYVKFVKINKSDDEEAVTTDFKTGETEELALMIDKAIDNFFDNHVLKFFALGRNISMPKNVEEFVGRKKRKGGGGGGGHGGGGHDDGGKKKMMMMAMMCMKMKLMMMVPAMMGMMGMMSFKGMMFSMMSFMISKMMLLMKILEKKGGLGGGGNGGGLDGGWAAGGAGGGAWMPAGGQDYAGGGGGGYDANGQWQSRSIVESIEAFKTINNNPITIEPLNKIKWQDESHKDITQGNIRLSKYKEKPDKTQWQIRSDENSEKIMKNIPEISFVDRAVRYNNKIERESFKNPVLYYKKSNVNFDFHNPENNVGRYESVYDTEKLANKRSKRDLTRKILQQESNQSAYKINNKNVIIKENKSKIKARQKRSIIDLLQNSYIYWVNKILGLNNNRRTNPPRYKIVNGVRYVYHPYKMQKPKMPKEIKMIGTHNEDLKPLVAVEDFNKGEIMEGIESRMNNKKFMKMKDSVNDTVDDDPWE